ncbi:MAG: hypothetical protein AAGF82_17780, partial [Pseudomonadota bacterium]
PSRNLICLLTSSRQIALRDFSDWPQDERVGFFLVFVSPLHLVRTFVQSDEYNYYNASTFSPTKTGTTGTFEKFAVQIRKNQHKFL